jgi:hypothetical protein
MATITQLDEAVAGAAEQNREEDDWEDYEGSVEEGGEEQEREQQQEQEEEQEEGANRVDDHETSNIVYDENPAGDGTGQSAEDYSQGIGQSNSDNRNQTAATTEMRKRKSPSRRVHERVDGLEHLSMIQSC